MARQLPELSEKAFADRALAASAKAPFLPWLTPSCLAALWRHYEELRRWNRRVSLVGPGTLDEVWPRHYGESLAAVPWLEELVALDAPVPGSATLNPLALGTPGHGTQHPGAPDPGAPGPGAPDPGAPGHGAPELFPTASRSEQAEPAPAARPRLLDLGSGAGFPGFVLAAALPAVDVTMVEAREKKWAFLEHAARRSGIACRCLRYRLEVPLAPVESALQAGGAREVEDARRLPERIDVLTVRALRLPGPLLAALRERMPPGARLLRWTGGDAESLRHEAPPGFRPGRVARLPGGERRFLVESVSEAG